MHFQVSTDKISKRPQLFFLPVTKYDIGHQHQCQHSIEVSHCQVCAEHPGVDCEHPGPKYNQSGACVTNHFEQENSKMFCIQGFIFARVPFPLYVVDRLILLD